MKKLFSIAFATLAVVATSGKAAYLTNVETTLSVNPGDLRIAIYGQSNYTASYISLSDGVVLSNTAYVRETSTFRDYTPRTIKLNETGHFSSVNTATVLGSTSDLEKYYHLVGASSCQDGECGSEIMGVFKSSLDGVFLNAEPITIELDDCGAGFSTIPRNSGFSLLTGCGVVANYDEDGTVESEVIIPNFQVSGALSVAVTPWITYDEEVSIESISYIVGGFSSSSSSNYYQAWEIGENGDITEQVNIQLNDNTQSCQVVAGTETKGVVCLSSNTFDYYTMADNEDAVSLDVFSEGDIDSERPWSAHSANGHIYLTYYDTVSVEVDAGEQTTYSHVSSNVNASSGDRYAHHQSDSVLGESVNNSAILTSSQGYASSPDGYIAVTKVFGDDTLLDFVIYDALTEVGAPYITYAPSVQVGTEQEFSATITYQDESFLSSEVTVSYSTDASWINVDQETNEITLTPTHSDVGESILSVTLANPNEQSSTDLSFEAVLTDYALMVFEPFVLGLLDEEEPVPLTSLIAAVSEVPVIEDEITVFTFSLFNREENEIDFEWGDLPNYIEWDETNKNLTVTPAQENVGSLSVELKVYDIYEPLDEDGSRVSRDFTLPLDIIEVDEPPVITSTPVTQVDAGEGYSYQLVFEDEETISSSIDVTLAVAPMWLSYDASTQSLVGTPDSSYVGTSQVQLRVQDEGGNVVVHSFSITVKGNEVGSSGGSMGFMLFLLGVVLAGRRLTFGS
jgi:hypothetical protein